MSSAVVGMYIAGTNGQSIYLPLQCRGRQTYADDNFKRIFSNGNILLYMISIVHGSYYWWISVGNSERVTSHCLSQWWPSYLTHLVWVTHIWLYIWTNAGILSIRTSATNFSENLSQIHIFSFKKMHFKMSSGKWRPFCLGLNLLRPNDTCSHKWTGLSLVQVMACCLIDDRP